MVGLVGVVVAATLPHFVATQARMKASRRAEPRRLRRHTAALAVGGFAEILVSSLAYLGPVVRGGGHGRLSAGFATTPSWAGVGLADIAALALLVGAAAVAAVAAAGWAADTGWRAVRLLTDHEPVEQPR